MTQKARFPMFLPQRVAIHHSASGRATTFAEVERWHSVRFAAVGYNEMINAVGSRKSGRMVPQRGAAVALRNSGTISILVMGHNSLVIPHGKPLWRVPHETRRWDQYQVNALRLYLDCLFVIWPHLEAHLGGHRDFTAPGHATECPGLDISTLRGYGWDIEKYWRMKS